MILDYGFINLILYIIGCLIALFIGIYFGRSDALKRNCVGSFNILTNGDKIVGGEFTSPFNANELAERDYVCMKVEIMDAKERGLEIDES